MPPVTPASPSDLRLRMRLVGRFSIEGPEGPLPDAAVGSRKARTLLKLLLVERGRVVPVDRIAEAVWSEPPSNAHRLIATLVSRLRAVLGRDAIEGVGEGYRFSPARHEVDVDVAERLTGEAEARLEGGETALAHAAASRAVALLGAEVLEDEPYAEWAEPARAIAEPLRRRARAVLWSSALAAGNASEVLTTAEAAIAGDPFDEEAHRAVMRAYHHAGRRTQALLAYERLQRLLADELGVAPSVESRELHVAIVREEEAPKVGRPPMTSRPAGSRPHAAGTDFVGRDAELAELRAAWVDAVEGRSGLVLLVGEAGIGKSALAGRLESIADGTGGLVLRGRCYEAERSLFLEPFTDAIRPALLGARASVVGELAPDHAAALADLIPEAGSLLGASRQRPASPEAERRRAMEACVAVLRGFASGSPALLVLDDLHLAGATTVELLHYAARRLAGHRLLIVGTVRSDEGEAALDQLREVAHIMRIGSLPASAIGQLADALGRPRLGPRVHALSGGHPLYAVELLRAVVDDTRTSAEPLPLPDSLREAVTGRARRLGEDVDELLRSAAVLGTTFDIEQAAKLAGARIDDAVRRANRARRAGLLVEAGDQLAFANDLVREILYETTPPAMRRARHRRAMELAGRNPEAAAGHAAATGLWAEAASLWQEAAARAAARFSNDDAGQLLEHALAAAEQAGDRGVRARVLLARSAVREALADYAPAFADQTAAVELARDIGDEGWRRRLCSSWEAM